VLAPVRVEIKSGGIRHVAAGIVRHNGDVIADLILIGIAFGGIKRVAYCHIGRPCEARVGAPGIE
jgi:hypothetical protein